MRILPALVVLSCVLLVGCSDSRMSRFLPDVPPALAAGEPLPEYGAPVLGSADTLSLSSLQGEVVLINAWATWCTPCIAELPALQRLHEQYGPEGFRVVGIVIDNDPAEKLLAFTERHGLTYPNLHGDQWDLEQAFRWGKGVPKSLLVDRTGKILHFWSGAVLPGHGGDEEALEQTIGAALGS